MFVRVVVFMISFVCVYIFCVFVCDCGDLFFNIVLCFSLGINFFVRNVVFF